MGSVRRRRALNGSRHWPAVQLSCWGCFSLIRAVGGMLATKRQADGRCTNDSGSCTKLYHEDASVMALGGTWTGAIFDETGKLPAPLSDAETQALQSKQCKG